MAIFKKGLINGRQQLKDAQDRLTHTTEILITIQYQLDTRKLGLSSPELSNLVKYKQMLLADLDNITDTIVGLFQE